LSKIKIPEFLKFVGPIGPTGQKIMRSANNVGNAGPHVSQTFLKVRRISKTLVFLSWTRIMSVLIGWKFEIKTQDRTLSKKKSVHEFFYAGRIVNTGTSSVNSEFATALNTWYFICFW
jgi:hypothetical protein